MDIQKEDINFDSLESSRIILIHKHHKYAKAVFEYLSHIEVRKYLAGYTPFSLSEVKKSLKMSESISSWLIKYKPTGKIIGEIDIYRVVDGYLAELGYIMSSDYWGQGLMFEAAYMVLDFAFNLMCLTRIRATIISENIRSINLIEKLGFKFEAFIKEMNFGGRVADTNFYSLTAKDFSIIKLKYKNSLDAG